MKPSSAVDSAVGDDGRVGRSVDIYAILCNSGVIQTMVRGRAKIVNRSRSPRLNETHHGGTLIQPITSGASC